MSDRLSLYKVLTEDLESPYQGMTYEVGETDLTRVAKQAAEQYHDDHGGYEDSWPVTIQLFEDVKGKCLGSYIVHREARPYFIATEEANGDD